MTSIKDYQEITPEQLEQSPFRLIGREWMLITAEKDGKVNTMTASWGGFGVVWEKDVAFITVRPQRYTKEFIDAASTFSLTFFPAGYKKQLAYLGAVSGRDEDKIAKTGLTVDHWAGTPFFTEANLVLFCRKLFAQKFEPASFIDPTIAERIYPDNDYHTLYFGEISKILIKK